MLYFNIVNNVVAAVSANLTLEQHRDPSWIGRHDICSFEDAQEIAQQANALTHPYPVEFIAVDRGQGCWPQYDVVTAPRVGDKISRTLNGDYYPDGEIVKISGQNNRIVTTSTGRRYYRRGLSNTWLADKHWALAVGHIDRLNPEF